MSRPAGAASSSPASATFNDVHTISHNAASPLASKTKASAVADQISMRKGAQANVCSGPGNVPSLTAATYAATAPSMVVCPSMKLRTNLGR